MNFLILKKETLLKISFFLILIGALFSYKLFGRLAISNILQVFSIMLLLSIYNRFNKYNFLFYFSILTSYFIANLFTILHYDDNFKIQYILFFILIFLFMLIIIENRNNISFLNITNNIYLKSSIFLAIYIILFMFIELSNGNIWIFYGFDDKSHAVIYIFFIIYLLQKNSIINSKLKLLLIILLLISSSFTLSRLVMIFIPFFLISYFFVSINISILKKIIFLLFISFILISLIVYFSEYFAILSRFDSSNKLASNSTSSHLLLIYYGFLLKFENISNIIFGIPPGSYGTVLNHSLVDFRLLGSLDPAAFNKIINNTSYVPMHSTHITFLLEYPIYFFMFYIILLLYIFINFIKLRLWIDLLFFLPFIISTMFYSSSNELYFYVIFGYFLISLYRKKRRISNDKTINNNPNI